MEAIRTPIVDELFRITVERRKSKRKKLACPINYDFVMFTQKALKTCFPLEEIDVTIPVGDGKLIT